MRLALVLLVAAALWGCAEAPEAPPVPPEATGTVTEVAVEGEAVVGFTLETSDGRWEILIDPARDYGFDLHHLEEHRETGDPVRVTLEQRDDRIYAVSIVDA